MPKDTNILIVRHAEKPDSGPHLSVTGQERAHAYAIYFQNYTLSSNIIRLHYLFSADDSPESHRPRLTLEPLSKALGRDIDHSVKDKDYRTLAGDVLNNPKYDDSNLVICWHHGEILALAAALGADATRLPKESKWPSPPWPPAVFGWLLQVCFDKEGRIDLSQTVCINQQLMYDDYGRNPPVAS